MDRAAYLERLEPLLPAIGTDAGDAAIPVGGEEGAVACAEDAFGTFQTLSHEGQPVEIDPHGSGSVRPVRESAAGSGRF